MMSREQERIREANVLRVVSDFLNNGGSIKDVSSRTGIPSSSVQRYLGDKDTISSLLGGEVYTVIQNKIEENKKLGLSKGGKNYAENNLFTKDELGKFTGSKKK